MHRSFDSRFVALLHRASLRMTVLKVVYSLRATVRMTILRTVCLINRELLRYRWGDEHTLARSSVRGAAIAQGAWLYVDRRAHAGFGYRREHRDLHAGARDYAEGAAGSESTPAVSC